MAKLHVLKNGLKVSPAKPKKTPGWKPGNGCEDIIDLPSWKYTEVRSDMILSCWGLLVLNVHSLMVPNYEKISSGNLR